MKKLFLLAGFVLGFVSAAHWDGARQFVQEISPVYMTPLQKGVNKVVGDIEKTGANLTEKVKVELKKKIAE